jgi:hypothetical protein
MYNHWHFAPWIGPIALVAPLLVLAVLSIVIMGGQRASRWCETRRRRSRGATRLGARPCTTWPCTTWPGNTLLANAQRGAAGGRDAHGSAEVLASDLDRDQIVDRLAAAVGEGRLSFEEGTERIDRALRSRHLHELEQLVADLPILGAASSRPVPHAGHRRALAVGAVLVVLAAVVLQVSTGLWALWPLVVASVATTSLVSRR